jgi:hypothetical protein
MLRALAALALCSLPAAPAAAAGLRIGPEEVSTAKALLAAAGTLLLGLRLLVPRWESVAPRRRRLWDAGLLLLAALATAGWWNFFQFNYPMFGHPSETYHYYVGSKYFRELGYTRLYRCTALADAESGHRAQVERRLLRNLETNTLEPAVAALAEPDACKRHFTPERWTRFRRDVAWFRGRLPPRRWLSTQTDHGYNGTPVWGLFGSLLARTGPASDAQILALRLLDPLLLALTGASIAASFGWRVLAVAALYWGTNYPAQYGWVGGSYLRQLELAAALIGICLVHRRRPVAGGFLLSMAALVRVYPALLLIGPALQLGWEWVRRRRPVLGGELRGLALGGVLGAATLLPLAAATSGGFGAWGAFAENSRVLLGTPLRNHMGLRPLLAWHPTETARELVDSSLPDPYEPWKQARRLRFESRRPLFVALVAGYLALLAVSVRGRPAWVALVLGAGLVPVAAELTCYYSAILVAFALLWNRAPPIGFALCGLSALGWLLVDRLLYFDEIFPWIGLASALLAAFAAAWVWRRDRA